ncbi:hypothetical protein CTI12_AA093240 [Artemisia annua]|uniref:UvrD-like helicase ATP-binding domain-containing protein n=1 Tax=Artemisia annua TaxID=35608 RepID=A0A2U1PZE1_ARTAN|nr:hypothetical protein CTI12_AA093240 [Artemisia annua]
MSKKVIKKDIKSINEDKSDDPQMWEAYVEDIYGYLRNMEWQEIKLTPGCLWPSARSGFQLFVYQDDIYLYGGYSKEVSFDKNSSEKGIVHHDMWILDPKTWVWNKVKKGGMPPGPRAGFSMSVHKKRVVLFGGVVDIEAEGQHFLYSFRLFSVPLMIVTGPGSGKTSTMVGRVLMLLHKCIAPTRINDQYLTNLLLKINAKTGGIKSLLSVECLNSIPLVSRKWPLIYPI